mmetsp:Transcript_32012/g.39727  ORF Transcript_32012/g.39727 Transcript_32012/m.39727 type:complete len:146 (-) Transcript_32012:561-998(-)
MRNPYHCLAILWFFVAIKTFFDLDMLKALPGNAAMKSYGRQRKPTVFEQNSTYPEVNIVLDSQNFTRKGPSAQQGDFTHYYLLSQFSYHNNVIDIFLNTILKLFKTSEKKAEAENFTGEMRVSLQGWQDYVTLKVGPILQAFVAT